MLVLTVMRVLLVSVALASYFVFVMGKTIEWVWIAQVISVMVSSSAATVWLLAIFRKLERGELIEPKPAVSMSLAGKVQSA